MPNCRTRSSLAAARRAGRPPPTDHAAADLGDIGRGAIDLLAGLRRHRRRGAVADMDRPVEAVSAGQPACRVDQHGLKRVADGAWHPDLGGALLIEAVDARPAGGAGHAEFAARRDALFAQCRLESLFVPHIHAPCRAAHRARGRVLTHYPADFGCCFAAIWFLYSEMPALQDRQRDACRLTTGAGASGSYPDVAFWADQSQERQI